MRINTNISALTAYKNLFDVQNSLARVQEQLSSGKRINTAKDDPAGASLASKFSVRADSLETAQNNIGTAQNLLSVASGGLSGIENLVKEMRALALQAADGSLSDVERTSLVSQIQQINSEIDDIVLETTWNGQTMLDGTADYSFQTGADSANFTTWQLTTAFDSANLYIEQSTTSGATVSWTKPTIADDDEVKTGTWQIEFTDATTFTYTTASGATGQGTTGAVVSAEGLTFTVAANSNYVAGDLLTFDTTAGVDPTVTYDSTNSTITAGTISVQTFPATSNAFFQAFDESGALVFTKTTAGVFNTSSASLAGPGITQSAAVNNEQNIFAAATIEINITEASAGAGTVTFALNGTLLTSAGYTSASLLSGSQITGGTTLASGATHVMTIDLDGDSTADITLTLTNGSAGAEGFQTNDKVISAVDPGSISASGAYYGSVSITAAGTSTSGLDGVYSIDLDGLSTATAEFKVNFSDALANGEKIEFDITKFTAATVDASANDDGVIGNAVDLSTANGARASLYRIDQALASVRSTSSTVGALSRRLGFKADALAVSETNTRAALSRIQDADMAKVQLESVKLQILQQTSLSMLAQAMYLPQSILTLFGG